MAWTSRMGRIAAGVSGAVDRGTHRGASYILELARELAPEDTGDLKASGHLRPDAPNGSASYQVVFSMPYSKAVEYGRSDMPNYPAQPFMAPAVKQIKVKKEIRAELQALYKGTR